MEVLPPLRSKNPKYIMCPSCHTRGRVNEYHPNDDRQNIHYVVVHDFLPGYWGRTGWTKIRKRRRCYIKAIHHHKILDELVRTRDRRNFWRDYERQVTK